MKSIQLSKPDLSTAWLSSPKKGAAIIAMAALPRPVDRITSDRAFRRPRSGRRHHRRSLRALRRLYAVPGDALH